VDGESGEDTKDEQISESEVIWVISGAKQSKPRPAPHCMTSPPGEFYDIAPEPLSVYSETFMYRGLFDFP